ncbi:uncharacterized protein LOC111900137 [Lactuca sativa]|uniref:uncharacterized protein LOC111900137 n=1 Tax=Lactuca sativa TaxID=4236 RepID=UPI000CD90AE6|nr:uncharacterized protein LOC111900137 [Lactuca sativa]
MNASIEGVRFLLRQGLAFRGHNEKEDSDNKERFVGLRNVNDTSTLSLKATIYDMLSKWNLSPTRIRGRGYDRASNMSGAFNGLKTLIMNEIKSARFVHCFAHQLQLDLVFVAKNHITVNDFFDMVSRLLNIYGSSYKRRDKLRKKQADKVMATLAEVSLRVTIYASICDVLEDLCKFDTDRDRKAEAIRILKLLKSFDFVFCLHLMVDILGVTNHLNTILQRKDQDIVNAMNQLKSWIWKMHIIMDIVVEEVHRNHVAFGSRFATVFKFLIIIFEIKD